MGSEARLPTQSTMMTILKKIWAGWKWFAHKLGVFNTKVLLTITYFVIIALVAIIARLLGRDLLDRRFKLKESYWHPKEQANIDLDACKRQF